MTSVCYNFPPSVAYIDSLSGEDLAAFHHHPQLGAMAIGDATRFSQTVRQ